MPKKMSVKGKPYLRRIVVNRVLEGIDRKGATTGNSFERDKNLIDLWRDILTFFVQIRGSSAAKV